MTGLFCTACGTQAEAKCRCNRPYDFIPASVAAKLAIAAHPTWTDRRIADAVGCSDQTIGRTRKEESVATNVATEKREGKDGKQYKARKPPPVAEAVTVRPMRFEVSEETETRRAPFSFIPDVNAADDAESAVQKKMVASLAWLENTVCDPKIDWGVVIDAVGADTIREIIKKLKSNLDQYQPYFERLMKLAPPKMVQEYSDLIKHRKLFEGACGLPWAKYFEYRDKHPDKCPPLTPDDIAYVGMWTPEARETKKGRKAEPGASS